MSPIKPRGPAIKPTPAKAPTSPKVTTTDEADQTIAEPPRDFTDEIFRQLTGTAPSPPSRDSETTRPMPGRPPAVSAASAFGAAHPPFAPPSAPVVHVPVPAGTPQSAAQGPAPEVHVRTPLWAIAYLGFALLAIAFGLFVLFMQSRVTGHF